MEWIKELSERLDRDPLPGRKAHSELFAINSTPSAPPPVVKKAGVMALFLPSDRGWSICFIQRPSTNPRDPHSGQISFPGGRMEAKDENIWHTSLRETEEEVGIPSGTIKKIGQLSSLYIPVSNFLVYPHIGYINFIPTFKLQKSEVSKVITPPVHHLLGEGVIKYKNLKVRNDIMLESVPHFYLDENVIWGATAMMLNELRLTLLRLDSEIK